MARERYSTHTLKRTGDAHVTIKSRNFPLTQIDETLCDIRLYMKTMKAALKMKKGPTRDTVLYVLACAYENANDTIMVERNTENTWAYMFEASVGCTLAGSSSNRHEYNRHVEGWFARRGFQW